MPCPLTRGGTPQPPRRALRCGRGSQGGERSPGGEGVFEPDTPDSDASRSRQMAPRERRGEEPPAPPAPQGTRAPCPSAQE